MSHRVRSLLERRSLLAQLSRQNALETPRKIYWGVDPTAPSLHVGHLLPLVALTRLRIHGHSITFLLGGATGRIGDPSGRVQQRAVQAESVVDENVKSLTAQLTRISENAVQRTIKRDRTDLNDEVIPPPSFVNNLEWHHNLTLLDFLRNAGYHARISSMLARDAVKSRRESADDANAGLTFAELTYQLLQAYDFSVLHEKYGVHGQLGGSDQWGNITAGLDLIRSRSNESSLSSTSDNEPFGITVPLMTNSKGAKVGKTAGNAVWLDASRTSPFELYQYLLRTSDVDAPAFLRSLTFASEEAITEANRESPEQRMPQRLLADEVTELVHGVDALQQARTLTELLFGQDVRTLRASAVYSALRDDPRLVKLPAEKLISQQLVTLAVQHALASSNATAKTLIKSGGFYLNNERLSGQDRIIESKDLIDGQFMVLRAGKGKHLVLGLQV